MTGSAAGREQRAAAAAALRAALACGDLDQIESLMVPDVRWYGSEGGSCNGREEVLGVFRAQLDAGVVARPTDDLLLGDRLFLEVDLSFGQPVVGDVDRKSWLVVATFGADDRIFHLQDYAEAGTARGDLALRAESATAGTAATSPAAGHVADLVPFVHVSDVDRSIRFYESLGFEAGDTYRQDGRLSWASLRSRDASLMLALGDEAVDAHDNPVLFYLYSPDLAALRAHLVAAGVLVGEILDGTPGPRQEMSVNDPDGYRLMIAGIED